MYLRLVRYRDSIAETERSIAIEGATAPKLDVGLVLFLNHGPMDEVTNRLEFAARTLPRPATHWKRSPPESLSHGSLGLTARYCAALLSARPPLQHIHPRVNAVDSAVVFMGDVGRKTEHRLARRFDIGGLPAREALFVIAQRLSRRFQR